MQNKKRQYHHRQEPCPECGQVYNRLHNFGCKYNNEPMPDFRKYKGRVRRVEQFRLPEKLDRRVKLTHAQKDEIRQLVAAHADRAKRGIIGEAISQRILARRYGVSRRTIQFILDPAKVERNKQTFQERGGWRTYYKGRDARKEIQKEHRHYKEGLYKKGLL